MGSTNKARPFLAAADGWLQAGWFPFPARHTAEGSKAPCVPKWYVDDAKHSVIGWDSYEEDFARLLPAWKKSYPNAQLGIRLPRAVLGIDVDDYDAKTGNLKVIELVAKYGTLPDTWCSTSRPGTGSGIYLYRVPDSAAFPHGLGDGIDLVRWCGRFMMAAPSTHPKTGNRYGFNRPDGVFVLDEFPAVEDLTELPARWLEGLPTEAPVRGPRPSGIIEAGSVREWVKALPGGKAEPCDGMRGTFEKYTRELAAAGSGSRHDAALRGIHALVGDATEGHRGLWWCLVRLGKQLEVKRGNSGDARGEFARAVQTEVERRVAKPIITEDFCNVNWNW